MATSIKLGTINSITTKLIRSQNDRTESQRSALLVLIDSVGWMKKKDENENWITRVGEVLTLEDLCNIVPGITCQQRLLNQGEERKDNTDPKRVQEEQQSWDISMIDWSYQGLIGSFPTEVGLLTELIAFQVGNNQLTGTLPESLYRLSMLEHFEIHRNQFIGTLPETIWSNMKALKRLLIHTNQFDGTLPSTLCQLDSLHSMDLFDNPLIGSLPECIGAMPLLTTLQIHGTRFTGTIPSDLCPKEDSRRRQRATSSSCDTIACPVSTFAEPHGRATDSSPCRPCRTAIYLASRKCPDELEITLTESPTNSPSDGEDDSLSPSSTMHPNKEGTLFPNETPTLQPSPRRQDEEEDWIVTLSPVNKKDGIESRMGNISDWVWLSIACLLSSLALLIVVVFRRRRSYWQQHEEHSQDQLDGCMMGAPSPHALGIVSTSPTPILDETGRGSINFVPTTDRRMATVMGRRTIGMDVDECVLNAAGTTMTTGDMTTPGSECHPSQQHHEEYLPRKRFLLLHRLQGANMSMLQPPVPPSISSCRRWDGDIPPSGHIHYLQKRLVIDSPRILQKQPQQGTEGSPQRRGSTFRLQEQRQRVEQHIAGVMMTDIDSVESDSGWNDGSVSSGDDMDCVKNRSASRRLPNSWNDPLRLPFSR